MKLKQRVFSTYKYFFGEEMSNEHLIVKRLKIDDGKQY